MLVESGAIPTVKSLLRPERDDTRLACRLIRVRTARADYTKFDFVTCAGLAYTAAYLQARQAPLSDLSDKSRFMVPMNEYDSLNRTYIH